MKHGFWPSTRGLNELWDENVENDELMLACVEGEAMEIREIITKLETEMDEMKEQLAIETEEIDLEEISLFDLVDIIGECME